MIAPTLYLSRQSGLHALHPLTKLTLALSTLGSAVLFPAAWQVLAVFAFALIPLAAWGRVLKPFLVTCAKLIWPFALSLFLIQGFFTPGDTRLLTVGAFSLKAEGISLAASYASRILVALGSAVLLMFATRPDALMLALSERGMPRQIAYIIVTSLQIIPRFQTKAQTILDAQQSRGLEIQGSLLHRLKVLLPLVAPLLLGSIIDVDERAIALEARAFSRPGPRTSLLVLHDTPMQMMVRWSLVIALLLLTVLRVSFLFAA